MIWHIYSHLYCSLRDGGRDLPSSGEAVPTMGQVPCEFRADRPTFIFQLVAPDVIWHIYLHLYCSLRDGGGNLMSSGQAALTMGKVPCEFWVDQPGCSFSGEELRQGSFQPCPAQNGASSMASSSRCDLAHLLWAGLKVWTCHLQGMLYSPGHLQRTLPRPRSTLPEDSKWMAPSPIKQHCLE